ncbi:MAG: hypothetical protein ACOH5I_20715 [Oligoflexus sp.]
MGKSSSNFTETLEKEVIFLLSHRKTIIAIVVSSLFFGLALEGRLFQTLFIPALGICFTIALICLLYFIEYLATKNQNLLRECSELEDRLARANRQLQKEHRQRDIAKSSQEKPRLKIAK